MYDIFFGNEHLKDINLMIEREEINEQVISFAISDTILLTMKKLSVDYQVIIMNNTNHKINDNKGLNEHLVKMFIALFS